MTLDELNQLTVEQASGEFFKCCGSKAWSIKMAQARPFSSSSSMSAKALQVWNDLTTNNQVEAFSHHPRIGERTNKKWESEEQRGTVGAEVLTLKELEEGNRKYESKFNRVFLICATGKSASEMLAALKERLNHSPEVELKVALNEQAKITELRLEKLIK